MKQKVIILLLACTFLFSGTIADTFFQTLKQKFDDYNQSAPPATLEFIFNQPWYAPGDTAFFMVNLLDATGLPKKGREMIRVIVSGSEGKPVLQSLYVIINGAASHYIYLPPELNAGVYTLCGYASSPGTGPLITTHLAVVRNKRFMKGTSSLPEISFFPEGGRLVAGVPNHVVATAGSHEGEENVSVIISSGSKVVRQFAIQKDGITSFEFTPTLRDSTFAEIKRGAATWTIPLVVSPDGCSLHVDRERDHFVATVSISEISKYRKIKLYLQVANRKTLSYQKSFVIDNGEDAIVPVPFSELPPGLLQLSIFDSDFNALADELIFNNGDSHNIIVSGLKENYKNRDKVDLAVSMNNSEGESILQSYTIAVTRKDLFPSSGNIIQSAKNEDVDQLTLITKKNIINWNEVMKAKGVSRSPASPSGLEINGRIFFQDSGEPVPDSTMISGILKNGLISYEAFTSVNGHFKFSFLYDFEGEDELFYVVSKDGKELHNVRIELQDAPIPVCSPEGFFREGTMDDLYADYALKRNEVSRAFQLSKKTQRGPLDWNYKFEEELMGADRETNLDQFKLMPTMAEVIKEVVPSLHVRSVEGRAVVRVVLHSEEKIPPVAIDDPLYCIDGELTKNTAYFLGLNPAEVSKIKLVVEKEKLERFGVLGRNGIVLVQTKRTRPEKIPDNTIIKVMGVTQPFSPAFPDYSRSSNKRIPDFRSCLYFNSFNADLKKNTIAPVLNSFYTSDDVGEYVVRIQGRDKDGRVFYWEKNINVSY